MESHGQVENRWRIAQMLADRGDKYKAAMCVSEFEKEE